MQHHEYGAAWARTGLVFGIITSVAGNIANACLTPSTVSIILRVPMAVVWPLGLLIAVEVLVRNRSARGWLVRIGQVVLLSVSIPTATTSFANLHALMIKAGEPGTAQLTGPLAIDGVMLGCTIMLVVARAASTETMHKWQERMNAELAASEDNAPVSPAPSVPVPSTPVPSARKRARKPSTVPSTVPSAPVPSARKPRAGSADMGGAVREMLADPNRKPVTSTERRYARVIRTLRADPHAEIGAIDVRPDLVTEIRAALGLVPA